MGRVLLVRHGQASFGSADYDRLSPLGEQQCERLGAYLAARGRRFDLLLSGTLRRQNESLDAVLRTLGGHEAVPRERHAALDEYDSAAVLATQPSAATLASVQSPEGYRQHFRVLRDGLAAWMHGLAAPAGMPSYAAFRSGIADVLARVAASGAREVLLVSSGGPISTAVGLVLQMPPEATIELNMRIRNSAVTEFSFNPKRHVLLSFNHLPHLDTPELADWVTYT